MVFQCSMLPHHYSVCTACILRHNEVQWASDGFMQLLAFMQVLGALSQDGIMRFINTDTCCLLFDVGAVGRRLSNVGISPNGRYLAGVLDDGNIGVFSLQALCADINKVITSWRHLPSAHLPAITPICRIPACPLTCLPAHLPARSPACPNSYLPQHLPTPTPAYPNTCLPHTCLPAHLLFSLFSPNVLLSM